MKLLNFNKVLCLSPHPDDVEYSMAGTIIKYQNTHFDILTMSGGGDFEGSDSDIRHNEVSNVWNSSGCQNYSLFLTKELKPKHNPQDKMINIIENSYLDNHDAIFVPTSIDSHFEHRLTNDLADSISRNKNISIIEYKTPSTLNNWSANMYVDISKILEHKMNMLEHGKSQQYHWYFEKDVIRHFHADFQSYKKGDKYVEQYKIKQMYRI